MGSRCGLQAPIHPAMTAPPTISYPPTSGSPSAIDRWYEMPMPTGSEEGNNVRGAIAGDLDLAARCVSGDMNAWSDFVATHGGRILHAIRQTLTRYGIHLSREEVEDLHAETLATLLADDCRRLRTYEGRNGCRLGTWVSLVAARTTLNHLADLRRWGAGRPTTRRSSVPAA